MLQKVIVDWNPVLQSMHLTETNKKYVFANIEIYFYFHLKWPILLTCFPLSLHTHTPITPIHAHIIRQQVPQNISWTNDLFLGNSTWSE